MAGQITWTISRGIRSSTGSNPTSGSYVLVGSTEIVTNTNLATNANTNINTAWTAPGTNSGNLVGVIMIATQNCTVRTNNANANAAQDTLNLLANVPVEWDGQNGLNSPFNGAVTAMYVICTTALQFKCNVLTY